MRMTFKDAVKKLREKAPGEVQFHFAWIEKDAGGKPVVLADTNKIDPKKDDEVVKLLKAAQTKLHATGAMALLAPAPDGKFQRLMLQPLGAGVNVTQLDKGVTAAAKTAGITELDIEVGKLRIKDKGEEFADEDTTLSFRASDPANRGQTGFVTEYAKDPAASRAKGEGGLLKDAKGVAAEGKKGFVIDPKTGAVHLFDQKVEVEETASGKRRPALEADLPPNKLPQGFRLVSAHHSSPLGGGAVAGAGELQAEKGVVKKISDQSGHYKPEAELTHQSVQAMKDAGVRLTDDTPMAFDAKSFKRPATAEEAEGLRKLLDYRKKLGLGDNVSLGERLKKLTAEKKQDTELVEMVKVEQKLRQTGAGASQRQAEVELGGKGISEEEFEKVRGDQDKINALMRKKYGVETALFEKADPADLTNLLRLNNLLRKKMEKATLGAETFLGTGGGEKVIRAKPALNESVGKLIGDKEWALIAGDRDKINEALRSRIGRGDFLPTDIDPEKLKNRALMNLLVTRGMAALAAGGTGPKASTKGKPTAVDELIKKGKVGDGPVDTGMPDDWLYNSIEDVGGAETLLGLKKNQLQRWIDDGDVMNMEDLAGKVNLSVKALYEKITGKKA